VSDLFYGPGFLLDVYDGEPVYGGIDASQFVLPRLDSKGMYEDSSESLLAMNGKFCSGERMGRGGGN